MSVAPASLLQVTYNEETTELGRTVGIVFVGYVLSMSLYGFTSYQLYVYFTTVLEERSIKRCVLIGFRFGCAQVHFYVVSQFPVALPAVKKASGPFCADNVLAVITIFLVHLAYSQRVRKFSDVLAAVLSVLSLVAVCLGVGPGFNELNGVAYLGVIGTCQVTTFVVAALTFVIILFCEDPVSSSKSNLAKRYDRMISVVFEKGAAAVVIQAGYLILFFSAPTDRFWIPFQFVSRRSDLPEVFFLSLVTLYINDGIREQRYVTYYNSQSRNSVSGFSAASNLKVPERRHNFSCYTSGDTHNNSTFVPKGASVFNISVTREQFIAVEPYIVFFIRTADAVDVETSKLVFCYPYLRVTRNRARPRSRLSTYGVPLSGSKGGVSLPSQNTNGGDCAGRARPDSTVGFGALGKRGRGIGRQCLKVTGRWQERLGCDGYQISPYHPIAVASLIAIHYLKGKPLIQRSYRNNVPASYVEHFLPLILEIEEGGQQVTPCFSSQGIPQTTESKILQEYVNATGNVVRSEILGAVKMKCYLSGMPELRLELNDKVMFESTSRSLSSFFVLRPSFLFLVPCYLLPVAKSND
ncbi:hypothetical protein GALMADRAFT_280144 [Galerina marginata CBS 339.88]|uniref:MHD domain-containing protein n=1 Tax=Galerina marginata (strain CBS 339.88) TaxID=685588 RepID=A0A067SUW1_GALM3|nr:hypothetical protein GALMADRAFT_280144 [Galerina marginata CBS 339.88]